MCQIGFKSSTGTLRENNEDACFVMPSHDVYVVADGVGGNNAGEIASRSAVCGIAEYVKENSIDETIDDNGIYEYFAKCLNSVNRQIYERGQTHEVTRGMATTVVIGYIRDKTVYIANVGDSRAYLFRAGVLSQITEDHTYVNELLKSGVITTEEAEIHEQKNVITRAVGADEEVEADFYRSQLEPEDIVMLCSDGLYGEVSQDKLEEIISEKKTMSNMCEALVEEAIKCGGRDNITVVCLKI
ncbi:MAG: Stp1/IreP family PP2C-type Ser/Thr phosphatase [Anaerovoracaceae bacterium]